MELWWTDAYPDPAVLRAEAEAMAAAVTEALLGTCPAGEIRGIYFKGSAKKEWLSPIDYVPEISDVDVHVLFREAEHVERLHGVDAALALQARIEEAYRAKVSDPVHVPRPQLVIMNWLLADPAYSPSPPETMVVLYGDPHPEEGYDEARERELAASKMLEHAPVLDRLWRGMLDKPGLYLLKVLRELVWRVSPTGPRVLVLSGVPSREAWSLSRTQIVPRLEEIGEAELAGNYRDFYLAAWRCFLSGYADSEAMREAVRAGMAAATRGVEVAEGRQRQEPQTP